METELLSPVRASFNSVGQRPTSVPSHLSPHPAGMRLWASLRDAVNFIFRFVGRCPTLLNDALTGLRSSAKAFC